MTGYSARTHVAPGELGTADDQNKGMDNEAALWPYTAAGQIAVSSSATALVAKTPGWYPDSPPASPNASDEELLTIGGLTEFDPDAKTSWTYGNSGAIGTTATSAADNINGLYRALPAGDFSIWTNVGMSARSLATGLAGILLWEDPTNAAKKILRYALVRDAAANFPASVQAYEFTNYTTPGTSKIASTIVGTGTESLYLRLRRTGTDYYCDWSHNGVCWLTPNSEAAITLSFVPTMMGIGVSNNNTGQTQVSRFGFFRYLASNVGFGGVMEGNRF